MTSIKTGDLYPPLIATLTDSAGVVNLTTATSVTLRMTNRIGANVIDDAVCTVTNAASGEVQYDWRAGDTDAAGIYYCEFHVTFAGVMPTTFPNDSYHIVEILPSLSKSVT